MFEAFTQRFGPREQEAVVLIRNCVGAAFQDGFWVVAAATLGMVFCADGRADIRPGRLEWPVTEEELRTRERGIGRFRRGQICRVLVRRERENDGERPDCWYVTRVLEPEAACPPLEKVLEEYSRPVVLRDRLLGALTLSRVFGMLGGTIAWNGAEVPLILEVAAESRASWNRARTAARKLVRDQKRWDRDMRALAARQLTKFADEWRMEDEARRDTPPITEGDFARRISLSELIVAPDGRFTAYYHDDGMFWGHVIEVCGRVKEGLFQAGVGG